MYLTKRDKEILRFIDQYKSITINQASKIFFGNCKQSYQQARKRLKLLSNNKYIQRYRKDMKSECIYFLQEKLSIHDLKILDVYAKLLNLGADIEYLKTKYTIPTPHGKKAYREADALIEFTYKKYFYPLLVEIDYTHFTSKKKLLDIYNSNHFQERYNQYDNNIFPTVLILRPVIPTNPVSFSMFDVYFAPFELTNLAQIL